jgi:hypothetical protein
LTSLLALAYQRMRRDEGQALTEYAFLLVGIVAVVATIVGLITAGLTGTINGLF